MKVWKYGSIEPNRVFPIINKHMELRIGFRR